ncbi:MAG: GH32 C-terminal domain-containing protein [Verrucomicrobia bacterium]|nr:GH32 C-terminal domain-containing protein [Verrucomicrobiota bacterium]
MNLSKTVVVAAACVLGASHGFAASTAVFTDAVAVWHFGDLNSADGKSPLKLHGNVKLDVELKGAEREASLSRGGDGKAAEFAGGWLDAGQGGDGRLNLKGGAMTMLLRLRNPSGQWGPGELFCKHGGHDKLVYNLFVNGDNLGFEFGAEGQSRLAGQVAVAASSLDPKQWHDVIVRYDGSTLAMFVDGAAVARTKVTGSLRQGNTEPVFIARRGFKGLLDHAALWQRALTDNEIITLSGGEEVMKARREAMAKKIEAKIGREGLTLADQLRGARELRQRLWNDPHRPRYHLLPPDGFWNDINGTIYWKGRYHVFFLGRLAPDLPTILSGKDSDHSRETWLHASSRDLVHWVHHPPALVPVFDGTMPRGLYSGDMMDNMPVPTIIVHVPGQGTCLYTAEDDELIRWKPHPNNPVIPATNAPPEAIIFDPTGWKDGDIHYALVGNKNKTPGYEGDSSSLFRSCDLAHWEYRGPFYKSERRWTEEYMDCACPDFFPLGDKHMLISHVHRPWNHLQYYIGRFDKKAERFLPEQHGFMSWPGGSVCAPETLLDGKGRRIFWGWIMEAGPRTNGWASVATLPRVLSLSGDNSLRIEPAPELEVLRYNPRHRENMTVSGELLLKDVRGDCLEISAVIEPGDAKEFGIVVRRSPDAAEETPIICSPSAKTLRTELGKSTLDPQVKYVWMNENWAKERNLPAEKRFASEQVAPFELKPGEPLRLRVFLDRSVLEVYANDRQCITQRIYPSRPDSLGVSLIARDGSVKVKTLDAWDVSPTNSW